MPKGRNKLRKKWFVAVLVERFCFDRDRKRFARKPMSCPCSVDENVALLRATNPSDAYRKAVAIGKLSHNTEGVAVRTGKRGRWEFVGVAELLPVYDGKIAHGTEVLWTEYPHETIASSKTMVPTKRGLGAFRPHLEAADH